MPKNIRPVKARYAHGLDSSVLRRDWHYRASIIFRRAQKDAPQMPDGGRCYLLAGAATNSIFKILVPWA